jgi:hypothetical protein
MCPVQTISRKQINRFFYYTGLCCGEMSCCLLRLKNRKSKTGGVYYTPDITISLSDKDLLKEVNQKISDNIGIITKIKGGYNLSFRGKKKVIKILSFFNQYPPILGDISLSKLILLVKSTNILSSKRSYRRSLYQQNQLENVRRQFRLIKQTAKPIYKFKQRIFCDQDIGYFLSGVFDAEGSVGLKKNGIYKQPFFAVAMRDVKIIKLFKRYLNIGHIHNRPKERILHFEINSRKEVLKALNLFLKKYPSKLNKTRKKIKRLRRILNDYTPGSQLTWDKI